MKTLPSYVCGRWHTADSGFVPLLNPSTEEAVAQASSAGVDFGAVLAWARERGGPALRAMTFGERGQLLKEMSKVLRESRDDLLDRLGPQDVLAFTGSADTARHLRSRPNLLAANTRVNVEADSLNAAVLGPDVTDGSPAFDLFLRDVVREITQKSGQKCTAVRRILAPASRIAAVQEALAGRLGAVVTGNPAEPGVTMGPLATAQQLRDAEAGVAELAKTARA